MSLCIFCMWFFVSPCVYVKVGYAATVTPTTFLLDLHVITKYVHILDSTPDTLTANMYRRCIRDSVCGVFNFAKYKYIHTPLRKLLHVHTLNRCLFDRCNPEYIQLHLEY